MEEIHSDSNSQLTYPDFPKTCLDSPEVLLSKKNKNWRLGFGPFIKIHIGLFSGSSKGFFSGVDNKVSDIEIGAILAPHNSILGSIPRVTKPPVYTAFDR